MHTPSPQHIKKLGSRRAFLRAAGPRLSAARHYKPFRRGRRPRRPETGLVPHPLPLRRGDPRGRPRAGKSAKRRQWRMKRAGFEEVPRLAGTTVPVSRSAQRWAREPRPYTPYGGEQPRADRAVHPYKPFRRGRCLHRPGHRITNNASVGAGVPDGPPSPVAMLSAGRGAITLPPGPWATPWRYFGDF